MLWSNRKLLYHSLYMDSSIHIYLYVLYLYLNICLHLCPTCKVHFLWLWLLHCFKEVIKQKNKTREDRIFKNWIIVLKICTLRRTEKLMGKTKGQNFIVHSAIGGKKKKHHVIHSNMDGTRESCTLMRSKWSKSERER